MMTFRSVCSEQNGGELSLNEPEKKMKEKKIHSKFPTRYYDFTVVAISELTSTHRYSSTFYTAKKKVIHGSHKNE